MSCAVTLTTKKGSRLLKKDAFESAFLAKKGLFFRGWNRERQEIWPFQMV
jgi:hypothetical protein